MNNLYQYPLATTPPTWEINDIFVDALSKHSAFWRSLGYEWKFGVEIEFIPHLPEEFPQTDDLLNLNSQTSEFFKLRDLFKDKTIDALSNARLTYRRIRQAIESDPSLVKELCDHSYFNSRGELLHELGKYERNLDHEEPDKIKRSIINCFLASLHIFKPAEGGLKGLIEPRFGDYGFGNGWWDGNDDLAEVRTKITSDPILLIKRYHWIVANIMKASEAFGIIPSTRPFNRHIHFSLWNGERNLMRMDNGADKNMCEKIMHGIVFVHNSFPSMYQEDDPTHFMGTQQIEATANKNHFLNQNPESWEYRPTYTQNWPHLAKDLALILQGAYFGRFRQRGLKTLRARHAGHWGIDGVWRLEKLETYYHPHVAGSRSLCDVLNHGHIINGKIYALPSFKNWSPDFPALTAVIQTVIKDNNLKPEPMTDEQHENFINKLGEEIASSDKARELSDGFQEIVFKAKGWRHIYDILSVNNDNTFNIDPKWDHPALREVVSSLDVKGRRTFFEASGFTIPSGSGVLKQKMQSYDSSSSLVGIFSFSQVGAIKDFYLRKHDRETENASKRIAAEIINDLLNVPEEERAELETDDDIKEAVSWAIFGNYIMPRTLLAERAGKSDGEPEHGLFEVYEKHILNAINEEIERQQTNGGSNFDLAILSEIKSIFENDMYDLSKMIEFFFTYAFNILNKAGGSPEELKKLGKIVSEYLVNCHFMNMPYEGASQKEWDAFDDKMNKMCADAREIIKEAAQKISAQVKSNPNQDDIHLIDRRIEILLETFEKEIWFIEDMVAADWENEPNSANKKAQPA